MSLIDALPRDPSADSIYAAFSAWVSGQGLTLKALACPGVVAFSMRSSAVFVDVDVGSDVDQELDDLVFEVPSEELMLPG
jgi:hypothetical protein